MPDAWSTRNGSNLATCSFSIWIFPKAVANSANRLDPLSIFTQLVAQSGHVNIHRPGCHEGVLRPGQVDQLLTREDPSRPSCEGHQNPQFGRGKVEWAGANQHLVTCRADTEVAKDHDSFLSLRGLLSFPQNCLDAGQEDSIRERLYNIVIGAAFQTADDVRVLTLAVMMITGMFTVRSERLS